MENEAASLQEERMINTRLKEVSARQKEHTTLLKKEEKSLKVFHLGRSQKGDSSLKKRSFM